MPDRELSLLFIPIERGPKILGIKMAFLVYRGQPYKKMDNFSSSLNPRSETNIDSHYNKFNVDLLTFLVASVTVLVFLVGMAFCTIFIGFK